MIFPQDPDILIETDVHHVIRELRHLQTPATGDAGQPAKRAAFDYLTWASETGKDFLPLSQDDLDHLWNTVQPDQRSRSSKSRFAWAEPRELRRNDRLETTIVWVQQTAPVKESELIVDVEGKSIRLVVHQGRVSNQPQITSVRSTTTGPADTGRSHCP